MGDDNAGGIGGGIVSDGYGLSVSGRGTQDSCPSFDGGGTIMLVSAVLASERLRLQRRRQRGWQRLVMVSAAVAVAFVLEVFCRWKAAFMVFLLLLLLQDVLVGRDSLTPPLQIAHFPSQRIERKIQQRRDR